MKLSIIIPCYNEVSTISKIIEAVKRSPVDNKEIIVVDDASIDGTKELLKNNIENEVTKVIYHKHNQGKGASIRDGIQEVTGEITIIQDADLEYDPNEYPKLIKPILDGKADVVYGSRFQGGQAHRVLYFWHKMGNNFLTFMSNMFTNLDLTDMETCYKVFKSDIIKNIEIEESRFGFEPEITAKVSKIKGLKIYEVGISYHGRRYEEGKKIGWKDGFRAIYSIVKYNVFK